MSKSEFSAEISAAVVLAADQPELLARFYGALIEQEPQAGLSAEHWRLALPQAGWLELYRPSRDRPQPRQSGRLALCLRRSGGQDVLQRWIAQACARGARLLDGPRAEPFGHEAWLLDPEANRLLLLVSDS
jgi:hypothetical protein